MAKKEQNIIVQNLTIKTVQRKTQDIENWKNAIKAFSDPNRPSRVLLYDLFEDISIDAQIVSTWSKRQSSVLNKDLLFVKDGKEDEEINKLLASPDMRRLIRELHNSIAWGYTLVQVNSILYNEEEEQYSINFDVIPRKHVHPEKAFECISIDQQNISRDFLYKLPPLSKYILWCGEPTDMGIFASVAQYVIYKRGDFGDWAQFAEMFGMPFREGRYDDFDEQTRVALERAMEAYGSASYAILPKNADFKLHDAVKGTAGDLYKNLYDACNAEISKIILGNTLTTEQGENGARSLGEVHEDSQQSLFLSDEKMILDVLNSKFKAILKAFGFNIQGGNIWYKSAGKDWSVLKTKYEVVAGIAQNVPVADDFFYEEFDIPKPDNYEQLRSAMDERILSTPQAQETTKNKAETIKDRLKNFFV